MIAEYINIECIASVVRRVRFIDLIEELHMFETDCNGHIVLYNADWVDVGKVNSLKSFDDDMLAIIGAYTRISWKKKLETYLMVQTL